ncbi:MAG: hypothetical protein WAK37_21615, partial [Pseudolabrys sp.]
RRDDGWECGAFVRDEFHDSIFKQLKTQLRIPATRMRPGHACILRHRTEGVGNAGCPPHPQPRVRNKTKHTSMVTTVTAGFTRHSRTRMVLTASFVLSSVIGLYCHRHQRIWPV